jgi:hypothetical protein
LDENGKFVLPHVDAEFKLAQSKSDLRNEDWSNEYTEQLTGTKSDLRMGSKSDPICSSAGCSQYKHPHPDTHPMDYFIPDFGKDHDLK